MLTLLILGMQVALLFKSNLLKFSLTTPVYNTPGYNTYYYLLSVSHQEFKRIFRNLVEKKVVSYVLKYPSNSSISVTTKDVIMKMHP